LLQDWYPGRLGHVWPALCLLICAGSVQGQPVTPSFEISTQLGKPDADAIVDALRGMFVSAADDKNPANRFVQDATACIVMSVRKANPATERFIVRILERSLPCARLYNASKERAALLSGLILLARRHGVIRLVPAHTKFLDSGLRIGPITERLSPAYSADNRGRWTIWILRTNRPAEFGELPPHFMSNGPGVMDLSIVIAHEAGHMLDFPTSLYLENSARSVRAINDAVRVVH
jgi:hypothetical protein